MEELEKQCANDTSEFVTVVSVGALDKADQDAATVGYVTVLTIGEESANEQVEEVLVYRLPGERLGFGLKFEGGTKASEFVKRLFIQSCAPDSPASRVRSSWGCLTEGDEVLEIDSIPVNSMTRIDCVRCLKESNVVIKLLVKHCKNSENVPRAKSTEDLPLVISAEKKRVPPPPPPVPPRKIPRKLYKEPGAIMVPPKAFSDDATRHQSPRSSTRLLQPRQSPEVVKRVRKLSDGPPDAEVYVDLFSQEPSYCLSESDDTGSSISTVVDRLGSFPTTTTSSFAGSLPSTPTSVQKQLTPSNNFDDDYDNDQDYLFTKLVSLQTAETEPPIEKVVVGTPLQPPANFQDAPLSYGDEDVKVVEAAIKTALETNNRPPPPPPRSKNLKEKNNNDYDVKNAENLPRLVDFVPKTANAETYEWLKRFLENEQRVSCDCYILEDDKPYDATAKWTDNDFYTYNWSPSSQLTTIGEDEEEGYIEPQRSPNLKTPIVIVESTEDKVEESCNGEQEQHVPEQCEDDDVQIAAKIPEPVPKIPLSSDVDVMDSLPINSRQPPDGHEFPDTHQEVKFTMMENVPKLPGNSNAAVRKDLQGTNTVKNMIAVFSTGNNDTSAAKKPAPRSVISSQSSFSSFSSAEAAMPPPRLHFRSQSLIDISEKTKPANDRWSQLVEQRRKGLSKLKGLIIPEHTDTDGSAVVVDLPEIKSTTTPILPLLESEPVKAATHIRNTSTPTTWSFESISSVPKYSPAFKRKSLQLQSAPSETSKIDKPVKQRTITSQLEESPINLSLGDAPKSLESITSPTRSDCSFEYISTSPELKITNNQPCEPPRKVKDDNVKSDESDNDSAVSSSQSSYMSRHSPPPSPNHLQSNYQSEMSPGDRRFLKAQSIEAINRKNILASAKCRSGRDLKVGSPLIQRKFDSDGNPEAPLRSKVDSKPPPFSRNVRTTSVTDLRRNFEKLSPAPLPVAPVQAKIQPRLSLNSTTPIVPTPAKRNSLPILPPNIIKPPNNLDTDKILQEALGDIEENLTKDELKVVALRPEITGGSVGITLAGGTDYETKEITVHKVRSGSAAFRDGRLQKGDRIISINGKSMKGVTHAESIAILKEPVPEVIIVAYTGKEQVVTSPPPITRHSSMFELTTPPVKEPPTNPVSKTEIAVTLVKDSSGLGFSMEGGKDSPQGDLPLIIKKLFTGGNADKCGQLKVGDELVEINGVDVTNMPRIDAWSLMKKLPNGEVALKVRR